MSGIDRSNAVVASECHLPRPSVPSVSAESHHLNEMRDYTRLRRSGQELEGVPYLETPAAIMPSESQDTAPTVSSKRDSEDFKFVFAEVTELPSSISVARRSGLSRAVHFSHSCFALGVIRSVAGTVRTPEASAYACAPDPTSVLMIMQVISKVWKLVLATVQRRYATKCLRFPTVV